MARIRYIGDIRKFTNTQSEEMNVHTISEILKTIRLKYGNEAYLVAKRSHILMNNENMTSILGLYQKLSLEDVIIFVPVCGGG